MTLRLSQSVLCLAVASCAADSGEAAAPAIELEPLRALDPAEMIADRTQQDWAVEYARWTYAQTSCDDVPLYDTDGSDCARYQDPDSAVFFLEQYSASTRGPAPIVKRTLCRIPQDKAIFVPVTMVSVDDAGLSRKRTTEQLEEATLNVKSSLADMLLIADGAAVNDLESRALAPTEFSYHVPQAPNYYSCQDGFQEEVSDEVVQPSYLTGAFVIFEAPRPGAHHIEYGGTHTYYSLTKTFHVDARIEVGSTED